MQRFFRKLMGAGEFLRLGVARALSPNGAGAFKSGSLALLSTILTTQSMAALESRILFQTQFEPHEGYRLPYMLPGQQGWDGEGAAGNGLVVNSFEGRGQQAYLGYHSPGNEDTVRVWQPLSFEPLDRMNSVVQFSVLMEIVDSTNGQFDDFRWSFYNLDGHRLFSLDFDNTSQTINYALDGKSDFTSTGFEFKHGGGYELVVMMNFGRNVGPQRGSGPPPAKGGQAPGSSQTSRL